MSPTVATNADDLRKFRNKVFAHRSRASITDIDFQTDVNLVSNAFTALHIDTKELHKIINQSSFPTTELQQLQEKISVLEEELQAAEPKSFKCLPPKPSHAVTERKAEVEKIMQMFKDHQQNDDDDSVVKVYVHGNPGCGKSQIARSVGNKFYDEALADGVHDSCTFVMTLNAESEQSMVDSYYDLARELGVTEYSLNSIAGADSKLRSDEKIAHLKTLVSFRAKDYSMWLVIFDNANELKSLRNCWPDDKWGGRGKILVTTQDSATIPFADPSCEYISLSRGMQVDDALTLLRDICQFSCDDKELEHSIIEALDFQPLAIACAAIYAHHVHATKRGHGSSIWTAYLTKLNTGKRHQMEQIYERTSTGYPLSMISAITIAVRKLVQNDLFRHVVEFLGLAAPAPIDLRTIVSFVTKMVPDLDEDIAAADIANCSLLILVFQEESPTSLVKVHKVIHDAFRSFLCDNSTEEEVTTLTKAYIETLSPFAQHNLLQFDLEFHIHSKMMTPHLKSLSSQLLPSFSWISRDMTCEGRNELQIAFLNFGDICVAHGHPSVAKIFFERALAIANDAKGVSNDENDILIATILNNLGIVFREQGDYAKAKAHHEQALGIFESLNQQISSPEIADSLNKLGNVFYDLGDFDKAKDYFCRSLSMRERHFGRGHATVAASLNNLGCAYDAMGEHQIAANYYEKSLALQQTIYGKLHPHVADCLCNLGIVYSELGSTEKAFDYHRQALEMRKKLYFPDHLLISESYNNIGVLHKAIGEFQVAKECLESALLMREKMLPKEDLGIAELLDNLGQLYMEIGELQKSKEFLRRSLAIKIKRLERDHCKVGDTKLNLGLVHERCSEFDEAVTYFKQAQKIYAKTYPSGHKLCNSVTNGLRRVLQQGQFELGAAASDPDRDPTGAVRVNWARTVRGAVLPPPQRRVSSLCGKCVCS